MTTATNKPNTPATNPSSTLLAGKDVKNFVLSAPMVDVRGWDVVSAEGSTIGSIDRIMVDSTEHKPRYLSITPADKKGYMLLPIGVGSLNHTAKQVRLDGISPNTLKSLPLLTSDVVTTEIQGQLISTLSGKPVTASAVTQWYSEPMFDAAKLFGAKSPALHS